MKSKPFVHLHLHTAYSLLDGACRLEPTMAWAAENHMPAVAMTDHGVMYGTIPFCRAAQKVGVKPIIGFEAYIVRGSRHERRTDSDDTRIHHLVLLAENNIGYYNLMRLCSLGHLEGFYYKPRIDHECLARHAEGLIGLSACLKGEVSTRLAEDNLPGAIAAAGEYAEIFGRDRFFLELQDHGLSEQRKVNRQLGEVARSAGVRLVASNDVHYLARAHARAHEVMLCMQTGTVMSDPKRMRYGTDEFYMKTRAEMEALFPDFPEAIDLTVDIAERCNVEIEFGTLHFPAFATPGNIPQKDYLVQVAYEGVRKLYQIADPDHPRDEREREIMARFHSELDIIERTRFINYFLVVWDFVHFAHSRQIPVGPGRGSGGGSLLAYVLGITAIDPLRYSLIFERFLNPERVSPPDFDIDFCQARRGEVIDYVKGKYGRENVAQIITFGSLGAKTVIRDVGRVLEIDFGECDRLAKLVPDDPKITLQKALEGNPEFAKAYRDQETCQRILDHAFVLEGLYRNQGTHAAGVVIGDRPLIDLIPLALDKDRQPVTQYAMEPLGDLGLLKMDFLGLKTLTVIQETVDLIRELHRRELVINDLPLDDKPTYALLSRGDTVGVFQLESGGMRKLVREIHIDCIEDLIAMIALYRPGPMDMLPDYVARKTGKQTVTYAHEKLAPFLKETYGVMIYQEQVQRAANVLAGYSLGEADILRRAMGKKKPEEMAKQRDKFVAGCKSFSGIPAAKAEEIFNNIASFAGYGFNKAHSAGYGIVSYQTAFLKANYPAEFMAALISSEIGNFDKLPGFIDEAAAMDIAILPPDVNASSVRFRPAGGGIRYGLAGIKGVGEGAAESVVKVRGSGGLFTSLIDFCCRVDSQLVNRKTLESLVRCGAFDSLDRNRARLFQGIDFALARAADTLADRRSGQGSLFDLMSTGPGPAVADELPPAPPWPEQEMLAAEKELLGVYLSGHPLTRLERELKTFRLATVADVAGMPDRCDTRIGGLLARVTRRIVKSTKLPMAVCMLEDLSGSMEIIVHSKIFEKVAHLLVEERPVLACGSIQKRDGEATTLVVNELYALDEVPARFVARVSVHIPDTRVDADLLGQIRDCAGRFPGHVPLVICVHYADGRKVFIEASRAYQVSASHELVHALERLMGEDTVFVAARREVYLDPPTPARRPRPPGGD